MKVTELGKYLRKLRIDYSEVMKEMADKLGITTAYLSAIELGKRPPSSDLILNIEKLYLLNAAERERLLLVVANSVDEVKLDFENCSPSDKELAVFFARKFPEISMEDKKQMRKILGVPSE